MAYNTFLIEKAENLSYCLIKSFGPKESGFPYFVAQICAKKYFLVFSVFRTFESRHGILRDFFCFKKRWLICTRLWDYTQTPWSSTTSSTPCWRNTSKTQKPETNLIGSSLVQNSNPFKNFTRKLDFLTNFNRQLIYDYENLLKGFKIFLNESYVSCSLVQGK